VKGAVMTDPHLTTASTIMDAKVLKMLYSPEN